MPEHIESVQNSDLEVGLHGHICLFYEGETELLTPVIPFIQQGVALGERCVYLHGGEQALERVLENAILGQEHDLKELVLLPVRETWLKGGGFNASRLMELLRTLCAGAIGDGFKGVRVICDMGWAGWDPKRIELLSEFELGLNRFAEQNEATLLCLYNRKAFPSEQMLDLAKNHPQLVIGGKLCSNPFFVPPDRHRHAIRATLDLDLFLAAVQTAASAVSDGERLRQELEQAYAALARKIYENWQEEDTLRAYEKELDEKNETLLAQKRRLQTVLQHIPAILMAFDPDDRLAACNHEFERVTGFRAEEVMGKPMLELVNVEGVLREEVVTAHSPQGGDYRGREWSLRCRDGSFRSISWSNFSRYVQIPGWINWIVGIDLTPKIQAELGLRSLKEELEARTGDLEAFAHAVFSDLSGQLSRIGSYCTVIKELDGAVLSPQCRELLRSINEATFEMSGQITALQRFITLAAGGLQPEEVDLTEMATEIAAQLRETGSKRPVTFQVEHGMTATGDKKLLRLALEQLLENAWNFASGVQHPVIQFGTTQVEGERSFYLRDNGPRSVGNPQLQLQLLAPRRLNTASHPSCGIGLATVQRIISLHRGKIWASGGIDNGSTLYFQV